MTSQREIEQAVRDGLASGALAGKSSLKAKVVLTLEGTDVEHVIDGNISIA